MILTYLDGILLYGRQCKWDNEVLRDEYRTSLEKSLEEIRTALIPPPPAQVEESSR